MPFVEIGEVLLDWVRISRNRQMIVVSKNLRDNIKTKKIRIFYDTESKRLGIQESPYLGYTINEQGRIRCRKLPEQISFEDIYEAFWDIDKKMIIVELSKPIQTI